jgi:hypothetical protein
MHVQATFSFFPCLSHPLQLPLWFLDYVSRDFFGAVNYSI